VLQRNAKHRKIVSEKRLELGEDIRGGSVFKGERLHILRGVVLQQQHVLVSL
jgi:hypothetical protein